MTRQGLSDFMAGIDILIKEPIPDREWEHYLEALEDIRDHDAHRVAKQCIRDWSKLPKPAQIRKSAERAGVVFRGSRPTGTAEEVSPLPPRGSKELAEGRARMAIWSCLTRAGDQGLRVAKALVVETALRESYVAEVASGEKTAQEAAKVLIGMFREEAA